VGMSRHVMYKMRWKSVSWVCFERKRDNLCSECRLAASSRHLERRRWMLA